MEEERKINRQLRDDPENDKLNDRLQQVCPCGSAPAGSGTVK